MPCASSVWIYGHNLSLVVRDLSVKIRATSKAEVHAEMPGFDSHQFQILLYCVQTASGTHPHYCPMHTGRFSPWGSAVIMNGSFFWEWTPLSPLNIGTYTMLGKVMRISVSLSVLSQFVLFMGPVPTYVTSHAPSKIDWHWHVIWIIFCIT
jgi:hypothetical protein